jgi:hypothetical protein
MAINYKLTKCVMYSSTYLIYKWNGQCSSGDPLPGIPLLERGRDRSASYLKFKINAGIFPGNYPKIYWDRPQENLPGDTTNG